MADFTMNSIGTLLSGKGIAAIAKRVKVPVKDVAKVLSAGIPTLLSGMKKNVSTKEGEASLSGALRDHSAADVSNVGSFLKTADIKDGKKILGHVLGDNQQEVVDQISRASGVTRGKTTTILALVAPLLLSLLGGHFKIDFLSHNLRRSGGHQRRGGRAGHRLRLPAAGHRAGRPSDGAALRADPRQAPEPAL